jgi:hypothetical protein
LLVSFGEAAVDAKETLPGIAPEQMTGAGPVGVAAETAEIAVDLQP